MQNMLRCGEGSMASSLYNIISDLVSPFPLHHVLTNEQLCVQLLAHGSSWYTAHSSLVPLVDPCATHSTLLPPPCITHTTCTHTHTHTHTHTSTHTHTYHLLLGHHQCLPHHHLPHPGQQLHKNSNSPETIPSKPWHSLQGHCAQVFLFTLQTHTITYPPHIPSKNIPSHTLLTYPPHIPSSHTLLIPSKHIPSHTLLTYPPHIPSSHTLLTYPPHIPSSHYPPHIPSSHTILTLPSITLPSITLPSSHYPPHIPSSHTLLTYPPHIPSSHTLLTYPPHIPSITLHLYPPHTPYHHT